jgi:two-component system, NtrC family, response regulator
MTEQSEHTAGEHPPSSPTECLGRILVVDDQESIRSQLRWGLKSQFEVTVAGTPEAARDAVRAGSFDAVTLDLGLPPDPEGATAGLQLLEELLVHDATLKVIVLTGNGDRANAVRAVQLGAYDYYLKPVNLDELRLICARAARLARLDREAHQADAAAPPTPLDAEVIGASPLMVRMYDSIRRVSRTDATVLICGESGTGKELVARAICKRSPRRHRPFVAINCGAIPENLVESELFGHEKGAFTGAHSQRKGRLEMAEGGTVFLDEISELPPQIQVKLLRVLQERQCDRVGGRELIPLDVRILAATNRDLTEARQTGKFREDLYYRLAVVTIAVPPLRERVEDLRLLATHFLERFSAEYGLRVRPFAPDALSAMHSYPWPGNVRELENRIRRGVIMAAGRQITTADLELAETPSAVSLAVAREEAERRSLADSLTRTQGNISRAAQVLGTSRPSFHRLLAKHGIRAQEFKNRKA